MRFRIPRIRAVRPVIPSPRAWKARRTRSGDGPKVGSQPGPGGGYAPRQDGRPDPGEVVWAWVPYEDDPSQGKDRPVLVIGQEGSQLLALPMTSRDHDVDAAQESRDGREWMDIGTGAWDARRRPSEVRLNRVLRLDETAVRREGAAISRELFDAVLEAARPYL